MFVRKMLSACLFTLIGSVSLHAQGYTGNLTIVTGSSSLTLAGSLNTVNYVQQAPGSLTTTYSGTVNVTIDPVANTIQFNGASALANNSGVWQPQVGGGSPGVPGSASANYGIIVPFNIPLGVSIAAFRNSGFSLTSSSLSLSGAGAVRTFTPVQTAVVTAGTTLDYNTTGLAGNGTTPVTGNTGNLAPNASVTFLGGNAFQVSFDVNLHFVGSISGLSSIQDFTGVIVANGTLSAIPEPTTYALIGVSLGAAGYLAHRRRKLKIKALDASIR